MTELNDLNIQKLFGVEDAENEDPARLKEYFFRNRAYENLVIGLPIRILVGHKGVGKSALLKIAHMNDQSEGRLSVWLQPNDLKGIATSDQNDLNALIQEWKEGINKVLLQKISDTYLSTGGQLGNRKLSQGIDFVLSTISGILTEAYPNMTDKAAKNMVDNFRHEKGIIVYIDDLDRGWEARRSDIRRISALLNAIRDIVGSSEGMSFRLGLRSDVYFLVRTSDESTDKIEQNIVWLTWTNSEILSVMAKRVETFFSRTIEESTLRKLKQREVARYLNPVIEPRFYGEGKWRNVPIHRILLSLTRKRPRDLVKLLSGAAREAHKNGKEVISTTDLATTFEVYSGERLQDIINEFRSELPEAERLLYGMRPTTKEKRASDSYLYANDQIITKLRNIMSQNVFSFTNGRLVTPTSLAEFLFKIDFITARKDNEDFVERRYFDQSRHLQNQFVDFGFHWEVHPAYRWALQPGDVSQIFKQVDLDREDGE